MRKMMALGIACLCLFVAVDGPYASESPSGEKTFTMFGTVHDENGAITDAWVRVKNLDTGIGKLVLTNGGKYIIPNLLSGTYRVDSWKWGFEHVEKKIGYLSNDHQVNFILDPWYRPATGWDLTEYDWLMILPGGKTEGGEPSDKMFYAYPTMLVASAWHGRSVRGFPQNVIDIAKAWNHKRVPNVWENIMAEVDGGDEFYDPKLMKHWPGWRERIIRYMKTAFGPDKWDRYELRHFPVPITKESRRMILTEYDIPTQKAGAHSVAIDSKGNCWFTETAGGAIGKVDAKTGKVTEYKIPIRTDRGNPKYYDQEFSYVFRAGRYGGEFGDQAIPHGPAVDGEDNVWISMLNISKIVKFEPKTETFKFYNTRNWDQFSAFAAVDRKRERVWVGGDFFGNGAHMLDMATGEVKFVGLPTEGVIPYGMNLDKEGNAYLAAIQEGALYRIDAETFQVTKYWPPTRFSGIHRICADSAGKVWVTLSASMKLGVWDPKTEKITEYDLPTEYGHPYGCEADNDDNIWFTDIFSQLVSKFNPRTKTYVVYPIPYERGARTAASRTPRMDSEGNIWFTHQWADKVYKLDPDGLANFLAE